MLAAIAVGLLLQTGAASRSSDSDRMIRLKPGSPLLHPDRIQPRTDSSQISVVTNGATRPGPVQIEAIRRTTLQGREVLEHRIVVAGRVRLDDTTWYDPTTLAPIAHRSHAGDRVLSLDYGDGRVRGILTDSAGSHSIDATVGDAFDPSALHPLLRSLAVRPGTYLVPFFNHEERAVRVDTLLVEGADQVETRDGPVPVWRMVVAAAGRRATYYIRQDDGVELKVVAKFGNSEMTIAHPEVR